MEARLTQQQWLNGHSPTSADAVTYNELVQTGKITAWQYPRLFNWLSLAGRFDAEARSKWPQSISEEQEENGPMDKKKDAKSPLKFEDFLNLETFK